MESTLVRSEVENLSPEMLRKMNAYWRAANYLSVGQIYLYDNPLLKEPLKLSHVKPLVVGHWGTTPGQNFIYVHLNRVIKKYDLDMFYIAGPGHGGPAIVGNVYLEGTWSEVYPNVTQDEAGLKKLFKQFSFPGGISSHVAPTTPGSIHEGGELGYSLSHAFGAVFDNPGLIVACVIGDGEAETGPLATAWHSNKLLDPITDGAAQTQGAGRIGHKHDQFPAAGRRKLPTRNAGRNRCVKDAAAVNRQRLRRRDCHAAAGAQGQRVHRHRRKQRSRAGQRDIRQSGERGGDFGGAQRTQIVGTRSCPSGGRVCRGKGESSARGAGVHQRPGDNALFGGARTTSLADEGQPRCSSRPDHHGSVGRCSIAEISATDEKRATRSPGYGSASAKGECERLGTVGGQCDGAIARIVGGGSELFRRRRSGVASDVQSAAIGSQRACGKPVVDVGGAVIKGENRPWVDGDQVCGG